MENSTADLIISNFVINLSPGKQQVYHDAFRVLKPGGRISISDIVAIKDLMEEIKKDLNLVSVCIGGAATIEETKVMLETSGFKQIRILLRKVSQDLIDEWFPESRLGDYVASEYIKAIKPLN